MHHRDPHPAAGLAGRLLSARPPGRVLCINPVELLRQIPKLARYCLCDAEIVMVAKGDPIDAYRDQQWDLVIMRAQNRQDVSPADIFPEASEIWLTGLRTYKHYAYAQWASEHDRVTRAVMIDDGQGRIELGLVGATRAKELCVAAVGVQWTAPVGEQRASALDLMRAPGTDAKGVHPVPSDVPFE